jgi:catechol 2,3-dioxygenase-like lactoylglutathione lyase family enzyme
MTRGLDHVVHAVRDLDAAADLYRRLGFTIGARNRHPWGTHNRLVQLPGFFVELLTVAEPEKVAGDGLPAMFGAFNQEFLEHSEGLSFLMLESKDAVADAVAFYVSGIAASGALRFERQGSRPDGTPVTVGFSLAFARDGRAPDIGFAVCQQLTPDNFWNSALQQHANTASGVSGVVIVAENPTDHHIFLSAFSGERDLKATSSGVTAVTPRGDIKLMDPAAFTSHYGVDAPVLSQGARLAALRFSVSDHDALAAALDASQVPFAFHMGSVVIGPETAMGATLVFEGPLPPLDR